MTNDCVTLWVGDALGPVERACLRSVLRQGHTLALYCYAPVKGAPDGVELREAADIIPEHEIFFHRSGSVAVFSDWFRYKLQQRGLGTWVDTDLYLLAPLDLERPCLFGEELPGVINNAVLRLPPETPMLAPLLDLFETRKTPRWLPWRLYLKHRMGELIAGPAEFSNLPWGSTGPWAITALARRFGLAREALPSEVFNPVPWQKADWIKDPAIALEDVTTERTVAVHLWNELIKTFKNEPAPEGSFLQRLQREGA